MKQFQVWQWAIHVLVAVHPFRATWGRVGKSQASRFRGFLIDVMTTGIKATHVLTCNVGGPQVAEELSQKKSL